MALLDTIIQFSENQKRQGLWRKRTLFNNECIHFDSNDYLSLATDPRLAKAFQCGYQRYPSGSSGSPVLSGYHLQHQHVERAFAEFLAVDECLLFSSGYTANLAITALLGQINAFCLIDKKVHASMYDGLALAHVSYKRYAHNDVMHLAQQIKYATTNSVIITDSIFSMSGQIAPLAAINTLGKALLVDEAHALGVVGVEGRGAVTAAGLTQNEVPLRTVTFGKAFATHGALVAGNSSWINALLQVARSYIYSTALSPAFCYGLLKTLDVVRAADDRRNHLMELIVYFRSCINNSFLQWSNSTTAIQQLILGCPYKAFAYADILMNKNIACAVIRAPTVAPNETGIRIVLNYHHTFAQIKQLFMLLDTINEDLVNTND